MCLGKTSEEREKVGIREASEDKIRYIVRYVRPRHLMARTVARGDGWETS